MEEPGKFESTDLSKKLSKEEYDTAIPALREQLGELQRKAKDIGIPTMIIFEGWDASGKGELMNRLLLALDPRGFHVYATDGLTEEERRRPFFWRFWKETPETGDMTVFSKSWYGRVLSKRINDKAGKRRAIDLFDHANCFEQELADGGYLIVKLFLHISKKEQKKRLEELEADPVMAWTVTKEDWNQHRLYGKYLKAVAGMIRQTDTAHAPWTIVEADDKRYATVKIFNTVIEALQLKIDDRIMGTKAPAKATAVKSAPKVVQELDLSKSLTDEEYKAELKACQARIKELQVRAYLQGVPVVVAFEGQDAAGKGGAIKRLTEVMDPRGYDVEPTGPPNDVEKAHHYLWRFWRAMPEKGHIEIFDRSWYGRVLVERVEGFCTQAEWQRAYGEINEMESELCDFGAVLVKLLLYIDRDEQLKRFERRETDLYKTYKITEDDWRNREKWGKYDRAMNEMLQKTSTEYAPWTIVESNDKRYSRIKVLKTVADAMEKALK